MKPLVVLLVSLVACGNDKTGPQPEAAKPATAAPRTPSTEASLELTPAPGCERKNRREVINARTGEMGEWVEVRCYAGDVATKIEIGFLETPFPTVDDYLQRMGKGKSGVVQERKLADGWIAAFSIAGRTDFLVEMSRMIAGKPVGCTATLVPREDLDRVIETCASVRY